MANIQTIQAALELAEALKMAMSGDTKKALEETYTLGAQGEARLKEAHKTIADSKVALDNLEEEKKTFLDYKKSQTDYINGLTKDLKEKTVALEEKMSEHQVHADALMKSQADLEARETDFAKVRKDIEDKETSFIDLQKEIDKANKKLDAREAELDAREANIADKEEEVAAYEAETKKKAAQAAAVWK